MDKEQRLDTLSHCLKTRNLMKVRELLIGNLTEAKGDKVFLMQCYELAKSDKLVFQQHNHERLEHNLSAWDAKCYEDYLDHLASNFSQMRYYLALQLAIYFEELEEKRLLEELQEKEEKERNKEDKKLRNRLKKRFKRPKRKRTEKERHTHAAIHFTNLLLILMLLQLIFDWD